MHGIYTTIFYLEVSTCVKRKHVQVPMGFHHRQVLL